MSELQRDQDTEYLWRLAGTGAERTFVIDAHVWTVREMVDPVTSQPVLIFLGTGVARRVRTYPANWPELSDADLYNLSWST